MALHPVVFVVVGVLVAVVSFFVGERFVLFLYLGVVLCAWGLFRLVVAFLLREPQKGYACYKCKGAVSRGAAQCSHCGAPLNVKHGMG